MTKSRTNKFIDTIDECLTNGVNNGIFQVSLENETFNGRNVTIDGKSVVNFGSCSYLGLEVDERMKQGAIDATIRYGTQYSASRAFSACPLYEELEDLFYKIFDNNPSILAATTTLTHVAAIPILVQDDDLVIIDHQVHGSVQLAVQLAKAKGTKVEMIRHNRLDILEDLIKENPNKYNKIWYMADGLYSMYGDFAPIKELTFLLEKYGNFHIYIDDAHGMSWTGKNGAGYVLSQGPLHPKMVLSTSLAKGFGTGGGVLILTDPEMKRKILTCGSSYTFSGPVQPPMLGASVASAKIHLSDEIYVLQEKLKAKIDLTRNTIQELGLPTIVPSYSPIFYLGLGQPRVGYNMVKRLLNEGFYLNIGIFPAVPVKCTGLRIPITNGQTDDDIKNMLSAFQYHFPRVLEEEGITIDNLSKSFNDPMEATKKAFAIKPNIDPSKDLFEIQHETTIHNIDKVLWDQLLGDNGTFDWEGCRFIEETFKDNPEPENNWKVHYLIIRDTDKKPILATFFTELLCKNDMIAPSSMSQQIEEIRKTDKYYLTTTVVMMGSLLSVGDHMYLDNNSSKWKAAIGEMIKVMNEVKQECNASGIQIRDIDSSNIEVRDFLIKEGFIKVEMPDNHVLINPNWKDESEYILSLSTKARWHFRRNILDKKHLFKISVFSGANKAISEEHLTVFQNLYLNVKNRSYNINTYELPRRYFSNICKHPNFEIIEIKLNSESSDEIVAVDFCYKSATNNYSIMAVGLDYKYLLSHECYRQALYQSVVRANFLNCNRLYLGMDASIEKQKFGVKVIPKAVYIQEKDNFNMELMSTLYGKAS
jgi:7-keto-8-aminopelargonate synthetase-like enzyme